MIRFAENLNKMIAAGLGGALEAPSTEVAVGHCIRYLESSGAVASFETNIVAPIRSLRVDMQPIQDLHGYDHPWPGGGNVNKLPPAVSFETITVGNSKITPYPDGHYHLSKTAGSDSDMFTINLASPVTVSTNQYINYISNASSGNMIANILGDGEIINGGYWGKPSANIASEGIATKWQFYFTAGVAGEFDLWPIISDTPVSEFTPYSNICPITGRDSVNIWNAPTHDTTLPPTVTVQLGQTVYGGTLDVTTGVLTVTRGEIASYAGETLPGEWISDRDVYAAGTTPTIGAQVVYELADSFTIDLTPAQLTTLNGKNNVWSDAGNISLEYLHYEETEGY